MEAVFGIMDELAVELGVTFKSAKDVGRPDAARGVKGTQSLIALGARFATDGVDPCMTLPVDKARRYLAAVEELRARYEGHEEVSLAVLDSLTGRLSWTARLCRWGQAFLGSAYEALGGTGHILRRDRRKVKRRVSREFWDADSFWDWWRRASGRG